MLVCEGCAADGELPVPAPPAGRTAALATRLGIALQALQIGADVGGMLVTQIAVFFQAFADDPFQFGRDVGIQANGRRPGHG